MASRGRKVCFQCQLSCLFIGDLGNPVRVYLEGGGEGASSTEEPERPDTSPERRTTWPEASGFARRGKG